MPGLTLDAGALIGFERNDRTVVALVARSLAHGHALAVPAGVVARKHRIVTSDPATSDASTRMPS